MNINQLWNRNHIDNFGWELGGDGFIMTVYLCEWTYRYTTPDISDDVPAEVLDHVMAEIHRQRLIAMIDDHNQQVLDEEPKTIEEVDWAKEGF